MFHIVSKIFTFVLMPAGIICILLVYAIFTKNRSRSKKSIILALVFFYFFSTPFIVNEALLMWETPPTSVSSVTPHDIGIVLTGGIINTEKEPAENVFLGSTADRIGQALLLYKKGKIKKIIISGGEVPVLAKGVTKEINQAVRYLIISGVPKESIFLENRSTNTRENALNTSAILRKQFPNESCLLITSAFHIKRAYGCFTKAGIKATPYGANYLSTKREWLLIYFLPDGTSMTKTHLLAREILGYASYKLFGWL